MAQRLSYLTFQSVYTVIKGSLAIVTCSQCFSDVDGISTCFLCLTSHLQCSIAAPLDTSQPAHSNATHGHSVSG